MWVIVGYVLHKLSYDGPILIIGILTGYGLASVLGIYLINTDLGSPTVKAAKSLTQFAKFNAIGSASWQAFNWMDVFILGFFVSPTAVAAYEVAWRVTGTAIMISTAMTESVFSFVSSTGQDQSKLKKIISSSLSLSVIAVVPSAIGIALLGEQIMSMLFSPEYVIALTAANILMIQRVLQSGHMVFERALRGLDHPNLAARSKVVGVILNLVLNIMLIPVIGLTGAAVATTVSYLVNAGLHYRYLIRFVRVNFPVRRLSWVAISSGVMGIVCVSVLNYIPISSTPRLIGLVIACVIVYSSVLVMNTQYRADLISIRG
jgi:O-antigen/teichoic acid export membrane protein